MNHNIKNINLVFALLFFFAFPSAVHALDDQYKFHVQPMDADFNESSMEGSLSVVHDLPNEKKNEEGSIHNKQLPSNIEVINTLKSVGLENEAMTMDAFDRDRLYMRATRYNFKELKVYYPNISDEKLRRLSQLLLKS